MIIIMIDNLHLGTDNQVAPSVANPQDMIVTLRLGPLTLLHRVTRVMRATKPIILVRSSAGVIHPLKLDIKRIHIPSREKKNCDKPS